MARNSFGSVTDMSRNKDLAGKTVYSKGMNVHYLPNGYCGFAYNPQHYNYIDTTMSIRFQNKEDALAGKPWDKPSLMGLVDWNRGEPDMNHKISTPEEEKKAWENLDAWFADYDQSHMG